MKTPSLAEMLESLSNAERNFIAGLDYGNDADQHRQQLDLVIQKGGEVNTEEQYWFPYEVIELGKNHLQAGHEREYSACMGIVLKNILEGHDWMNDVDTILDTQKTSIDSLPSELKEMIHGLLDEIIKKT